MTESPASRRAQFRASFAGVLGDPFALHAAIVELMAIVMGGTRVEVRA